MAYSAAGTTCLTKAVDRLILLPFFLVLALATPLIDLQVVLPGLHPKALADLHRWYGEQYGDYLSLEKPHFFLGLVWVEVVLLWPLSVASCYAIVAGKWWFRTTCLAVGVSTVTSMAAIMAEMLGSGRASNKLFQMYTPFAVFSIIATLRGFIPSSSATTSTVVNGKKID